MTHHKPPPSFEAALDRISGLLGGRARMAEIVGRSRSQVYAWGNPETDDDCPIGCALKLDLAFAEAGGLGLPMKEAYMAQVDAAAALRFADAVALGKLLPEVMRETNEANLAIVEAMQPGATPAHGRMTVTEIDQAIMALQRARVVASTLADRKLPAFSHTPELEQAGASQAPP